MRICFICDLHLPFEKSAIQYKVLDWALADIKKKKPECIVYAGDVTCDGTLSVYQWFLEKMNSLNIPFLYIPGNSDLRCNETKDQIVQMASPCRNRVKGIEIIALNDCERTISEQEYTVLSEASKETIVFMHHPITVLKDGHSQRMQDWRENHKETMVFYGHLHKSAIKQNSVSLQAMDPDKAIGECPCLTYYDTDTRQMRKDYYFCPVPRDLYAHFGISCYRVESDIAFAIENGLKNLELRPDVVAYEFGYLKELIEKWRAAGGENLSIHLPDICYVNGEVCENKMLDKLIELADFVKADRLTQHVPVVSVQVVKEDKESLHRIARFLAEKINMLKHPVVIGVENMHMTAKDRADDSRRFGYLPEECLVFMQILQEYSRHKVGINFDIGHARNNIPYSQKYQIGTWLAMVGKYAVGYHIHQVTSNNGVFGNHMPITEIYGHLISYASFFKYWMEEEIQKVPIIFEMRPENAYAVTLNTFRAYEKRKVSDLHSHTYYSLCGRDMPHKLIQTMIHNGIDLLGISDHNYGIGNRKGKYLTEIRDLSAQYKDKIQILCGIEIATLPQLYDINSYEEIQEYDYCLIEHIMEPDSIAGPDLLAFCAKLGIPCGIAHTDLFAYCDMYHLEYLDYFRKLADAGIFWEMNVSYDSIHQYKEHAYVREFMLDNEKQEVVKQAGLYLSVGFDGHRCEDYDGAKVHEMYDYLTKQGFLVVNENYFKLKEEL